MKLTRTTKETIVILTLVLIAVLAIVAILLTRDSAVAAGSVHSNPVAPVYRTVQQNTGECGYLHEVGYMHRNGSDDYCTSQPATENAVESLPVANSGIVEQVSEVATLPAKVAIPADKSDKKHCNNGNGNGSEGCNASDRGNQDETSAKGDKADNRDTGNSDGEHGNSEHANNGHGGGN